MILVYFKDGKLVRKDYDYIDPCFDEFLRVSKEGYNAIAKGPQRILVNIAKDITLEDYEMFKANVRFFSSEDEDNMEITNNVVRNGFDDIDDFVYADVVHLTKMNNHLYDLKKAQAILKSRKSKKVLDIFLRKKLNMLTKEEEEMYHRYEDFDLDTLLFGNDIELDPLNTDNCGVISIFLDTTYKSTNVTNAHSATEEKHCRWYDKTHDIPCDENNSIHIRVFKETITLFIPEHLNNYQIEELDKVIMEIDDLCKFHNKKITIECERYYDIGGVMEEYSSIREIKEMIEREKSNESINHI